MYYSYFGLSQPPFRITPDTRLFFPGGNRGAVLEALVYAISNGEGIVKVVGEVGSGKTMLCRMLEVELPDNVEIIYLVNPSLSPHQILHAIAFELHLPVDAADDRLRVMHALHQFLLKKHAENRRVVMFVEEAQSMPVETLEEIRLLSNLETQHEKLLQIVLFGQPELDQNLSRQDIRQLKERITYSFTLGPFTADQIKEYLNSRLRACGYKGMQLFTPGAVRIIERYSRGLLRRINILADKALLAAYAGNATTVTRKQVRRAIRDSEFAPRPSWRLVQTGTVIAVALVVVTGLYAWSLHGDAGGSPKRGRRGHAPMSGLVQPKPGDAAAVATRSRTRGDSTGSAEPRGPRELTGQGIASGQGGSLDESVIAADPTRQELPGAGADGTVPGVKADAGDGGHASRAGRE